MPDDYRFADLSLTPTMFAQLLLELAPGRLIRRNEAVELVRDFHERNGGAETTTDLFSTAKKAFSNLIKQDLARSTGAYGYYRLMGVPAEVQEESDDEVRPEPDATDTTIDEYVYVYYLPTYKESAELRGEARWPHKVGMTTTTVPERLRSQVGTALPERPVISRVFACDDAALLERAFHSILTLRGQRVSGAPGNEWFLTNNAELDHIAAFVGWTATATATANHADPAPES